jgi:HPt (histidine-containing phosphotransfer) domain-containing protein
MFSEEPAAQFTARAGGGLHIAIDAGQLRGQTAGDVKLERELLTLFRREARGLMMRFDVVTDPAARAELAHKLRGSALAIGAGRVAIAAAAIEKAARAGEPVGRMLAELAEALAEVNAAIELRTADR